MEGKGGRIARRGDLGGHSFFMTWGGEGGGVQIIRDGSSKKLRSSPKNIG